MGYKWDFSAVLMPPEFWLRGAGYTVAYAAATTAAVSRARFCTEPP